ncbi:hypothetical protein EHQ23_06885 [Leptospira bourretii]|uniref:Uncharacterized protein n=1 Tax=Leptospira bourretii TaxID=2484962 RepID=A0A4R9IJ35_9LEPT|nr:hypothetical protein [Leptospira bourretii]TGK88544.1 hypothetical protein EHQ23_06885 [Leptospira bourretii]TGK89190.1 hypothetical protein EHQ26_19410 [Leptospira bourretii]TGL29104.1 hypothetical protein EHQ45_15690 [Leptospira bourretii]
MRTLIFIFIITITFLSNCIIFNKPNINTYNIERDFALGEKIVYNNQLKNFEKTSNFKGKTIIIGTVQLKKSKVLLTNLHKICYDDSENTFDYIKGLTIVKIYRENGNLCFENQF